MNAQVESLRFTHGNFFQQTQRINKAFLAGRLKTTILHDGPTRAEPDGQEDARLRRAAALRR